MAETEHKVLVKFTAQTKELKDAMAQVSKDAKKLSNQTAQFSKKDLGTQKELNKLSTKSQKQNKQDAPLALQQMKKQTKELQAQNKELKAQHSLWQKIRTALFQTSAATKEVTKGGRGGRAGRGGRGQGQGPGGGTDGGGRSGGGGVGGFLRGAGVGIAGLGVSALTTLLTMPFAAAGTDYQQYMNYARSQTALAGMNKGAKFGAGFNKTDLDVMKDKMIGLGYSPEETMTNVRTFGRATGSGMDATRGMTAARATGMDASEIASIFAEIRKGGGGFGEKGNREFGKLLQAAVKGGVDASTLPEYFEGVTSLVSRAGGGAGGAVSTLPYAQLMSLFSKSGQAGLKGARGASVVSALEEGFKTPGGGDEGNAVIRASLGFGRVGGVSYYEAKKTQEQGFQGPGGSKTIKNLFDYVDRITGGGEESNLYMEGLLGNRLTLDQIEKVRGAFDGGKSQGDIDKMLSDMTATEVDYLRSIDTNITDLLHAGIHSAEVQNKGIARGKEYAESIESIQETMQDFLTATMPMVATTLQAVAESLKILEPTIKDLGTFMKETFGKTETPMQAVSSSVSDAQDKYNKLIIASGRRTLTTEEEEALISGTTDLLKTTTDKYNLPVEDLSQGMLAQRYMQAQMPGGQPFNIPMFSEEERRQSFRESTAQQALEQIQNQLTALARSRNIEIEGRVDTAQEMMTVLRSVGIAIDPGARAQVDTTGGVTP